MNAHTHQVWSHSVVPLASVRDAAHIDVIGDGLAGGGLPIVEVALRGELGMIALERLASRGDLLVGAGTVLTVDQARSARDAGAAFLVSPGLDAGVVRFAQDADLPIIPGVLTPTEIQAARSLGLSRVKLFPAGVFGALTLVAAYADVFRDMQFMPSGGIGPANLVEVLGHPAVFAASGSWITAAATEGVDAVATRAREAATLARSITPGH